MTEDVHKTEMAESPEAAREGDGRPQLTEWQPDPQPDLSPLVYHFVALTCGGAAFWAASLAALGLYLPLAIPVFYLIASALNVALLRQSGDAHKSGGLQAGMCLALPLFVQILLGGLEASGAVMLWSAAALLGAANMRRGSFPLGWAAAFLALTVGMIWADPYFADFRPPQLSGPNSFSPWLLYFNLAAVPTVIFLLARRKADFEQKAREWVADQRDEARRFSEEALLRQQEMSEQSLSLTEANKEVIDYAEKLLQAHREIKQKQSDLTAAKARADELLYNIFPEAVADELKANGTSKPRYYGRVTVLFSDFEGFTKIASEMRPEEVVSILEECFEAFDEIVSRYQLEKIKTLGDGYMCAGGLPRHDPNHAVNAVGAALEMKRFTEELNRKRAAQGLPTWKIRVGMHTGSVVAGVVGKKKLLYDIWGDAVNVASRMEQHGEIGRINISGDTYKQVKHLYHCMHRGRMEIRNKGEIDMYFVEGRL